MRLASLLPLLAACGRLGFSDVERTDASELPLDARCDPGTTADTVALYSFESALTADTTAAHDATNVDAVTSTDGTCGSAAARFDGVSHLVVPDSPAFDLAEGSVELFARVPNPATGEAQGLISRDALDTDFDGHISIAVA
ncbi:MAG: hypothetical protein H0T65_17175, partial [Deltaproteobacteria bacterium]|nr:hypothetical protein [Deltaproteobacteria bacterium]